MRLLLDTHILLWWLSSSQALPPGSRRAIESAREVFVSSATAWEISIKKSAGKLEAPDDLSYWIGYHRFKELPITVEHGLRAGALPRHHGDPFDRVLVAQAQHEGLILVTQDNAIHKYDVAMLSS